MHHVVMLLRVPLWCLPMLETLLLSLEPLPEDLLGKFGLTAREEKKEEMSPNLLICCMQLQTEENGAHCQQTQHQCTDACTVVVVDGYAG